jgi:hypothetical protein
MVERVYGRLEPLEVGKLIQERSIGTKSVQDRHKPKKKAALKAA